MAEGGKKEEGRMKKGEGWRPEAGSRRSEIRARRSLAPPGGREKEECRMKKGEEGGR
jgi:hypothetical protein